MFKVGDKVRVVWGDATIYFGIDPVKAIALQEVIGTITEAEKKDVLVTFPKTSQDVPNTWYIPKENLVLELDKIPDIQVGDKIQVFWPTGRKPVTSLEAWTARNSGKVGVVVGRKGDFIYFQTKVTSLPAFFTQIKYIKVLESKFMSIPASVPLPRPPAGVYCLIEAPSKPEAPVVPAKQESVLTKQEFILTEQKPVPTKPQELEILTIDGKTFLGCGRATLEIQNPEDASLVPPVDKDYLVSRDRLEQLALSLQYGENVLLVGPTGAGKTTGVEALAAATRNSLVVQNMRGDIRSSAFLGSLRVSVDSATGQAVTIFQEGILPKAMQKGYWLLLDELDAAPPMILFNLQRVLTHKQLILDDDGGRVIQAHPNFRLIAAANTLGRGDETGLYTGTQVLNEAFLDRFAVVLEVGYLGTQDTGSQLKDSDEEVQAILIKSKLEIRQIKQMVSIARLVREAYAAEKCFCTFSTRRLLAWAHKTRILCDIKLAAKLCILNKLNKSDRVFVAETIDRVLG